MFNWLLTNSSGTDLNYLAQGLPTLVTGTIAACMPTLKVRGSGVLVMRIFGVLAQTNDIRNRPHVLFCNLHDSLADWEQNAISNKIMAQI